ncbi:MAG: hypothetical protein H6656_19740 [Ardenticatenaceae bacterium]|nr:hypothetical protein [Ardenticatenaceae bacterium]
MRKIIYIMFSMLLLFLAMGCRSGEAETAVPAQPTDTVETDTQTVSAKPQLIEFYADW